MKDIKMTVEEIVKALRMHNDKKLSDCSKCPLSEYELCYELLLQNAIDCIERYAISKPQGEWLKSDIPESVLAKCSICGFDCGAYTYNFCPNCGADMRGNNNV